MTPDQFQTLTGYQFRHPELLQQALTHRSYSRRENNERLEFLGDSVLNLVISSHIYQRFDEASEGELSRIRANLVKQATLAELAREIDLGEHIRLGGGELKSGGHRRSSILSDVLEAIIGAVYLDSDYVQTEQVVLGLYRKRLAEAGMSETEKDPKTRLQEYLQARRLNLPTYRVDATHGKAHDQRFTVSCRISDLRISSQGSGTSRKKAEQDAAQNALRQLQS